MRLMDSGSGILHTEGFSEIIAAESGLLADPAIKGKFFQIPDIVHTNPQALSRENLIRLLDSRSQDLYVGPSSLLRRVMRTPFPFEGSLFDWNLVSETNWRANSVGIEADYAGPKARYALVYIGQSNESWINGNIRKLTNLIPQAPVVKTCSWA